MVDCVKIYFECYWFTDKSTKECAEELHECIEKHGVNEEDRIKVFDYLEDEIDNITEAIEK